TVFEAFGVLKAKRNPTRPDSINQAQYVFAASSLLSLVKDRRLRIFDPRMSKRRLLRVVAEAHSAHVDVLDAMQLELTRRLMSSAPRARVMLVTTDEPLERAAEARAMPGRNPNRADARAGRATGANERAAER